MAARMGMIQTVEIRVRLPGTSVASGSELRSTSSAIPMRPLEAGIPYQPRVESLRGDHRQNHHRGEKRHPRSGLDGHQRTKLDQRHDEGVDEDIEHGPASNEFDHAV